MWSCDVWSIPLHRDCHGFEFVSENLMSFSQLLQATVCCNRLQAVPLNMQLIIRQVWKPLIPWNTEFLNSVTLLQHIYFLRMLCSSTQLFSKDSKRKWLTGIKWSEKFHFMLLFQQVFPTWNFLMACHGHKRTWAWKHNYLLKSISGMYNKMKDMKKPGKHRTHSYSFLLSVKEFLKYQFQNNWLKHCPTYDNTPLAIQ